MKKLFWDWRSQGWVFVLIWIIVFAMIPFGISVGNLLVAEDILILSVFALATNLLIGYSGLISFGQAVFYGTSVYVIGILWQHFHQSFWLGFVVGPIFAAVVAGLLGIVMLRAREFYFGLLTLGMSQLFYEIADIWQPVTGGNNGITGIHIPQFLMNPMTGYYFVLLIAAIAVGLLLIIIRSPFGLTLRAIRENRNRAEGIGINTRSYHLWAFIISGFFCGLAGGLFVLYAHYALPSLLDWQQSGTPVMVTILGGLSTIEGPLLGSVVYVVAENFFGSFTSDWELVVGVIMLGIILIYPRGLADLLEKLGGWILSLKLSERLGWRKKAGLHEHRERRI